MSRPMLRAVLVLVSALAPAALAPAALADGVRGHALGADTARLAPGGPEPAAAAEAAGAAGAAGACAADAGACPTPTVAAAE